MKKQYWKQCIKLNKMSAKELAALRKLIKEHCKENTEGGVVTFDAPSPTCAPGEQC